MPNQLGVALSLDRHGKVNQIMQNLAGLSINEGSLFPALFPSSEFSQAMTLLQELQQQQVVYDVPLSVCIDDKYQYFYFSGVAHHEDFIVIGTQGEGMDVAIFDELAKVNNEMANALRDALKRQNGFHKDANIDLDEFTKLNNQLVNTQRELNRSNKKLKEINAEKDHLLSMAAHDLRNPLGIITSYINFVLNRGNTLDERQQQMLAKAYDTAKIMLKMLEELLDISKIESGYVTLNKVEMDIDSLIKETVELNQVIAEKKAITLNYHSPGTVELQADPVKLQQVINNLISNAIKYSNRETTATITLEDHQDQVELSVTDQGQGIPKDELDLVFKPFAKTSVKTTAGEDSTGLGLAITQKIVATHGGTITVSSELGKGTIFTVHLPKT